MDFNSQGGNQLMEHGESPRSGTEGMGESFNQYSISSPIPEVQLRKKILDIQGDNSLSQSEKAKKIQLLMSSGWSCSTGKFIENHSPSHGSPSSSTITTSTIITDLSLHDAISNSDTFISTKSINFPNENTEIETEIITYHKDNILGCPHYRTNCRIGGNCPCPSNRWFPCRLCHDEECDHELARNLISRVQCMKCKFIIQDELTNTCPSCNSQFALYFCKKCGLYDNDPSHQIFHCEDCGICRRGLSDHYKHCKKCNACVNRDYFKKHRCIERNLECDCPICGEYLFTSRLSTIFMSCGHSIHRHCYSQHLQNSYSCPICMKSIGNVGHFFAQLEIVLREQKMPEEYKRHYNMILCNDCEKKSWASFHFMYHKCGECGSFNTKVIKTKIFETDESLPEIKNVKYIGRVGSFSENDKGDEDEEEGDEEEEDKDNENDENDK